nr:hypothetical protein [uncultured Halomonas sp.]
MFKPVTFIATLCLSLSSACALASEGSSAHDAWKALDTQDARSTPSGNGEWKAPNVLEGGRNRVNALDGSNRINALDGSNRVNALDGSNRINALDGSNRVNALDGSNRINALDGRNRVNALE